MAARSSTRRASASASRSGYTAARAAHCFAASAPRTCRDRLVTDLDVYINFTIYAILGRLGEADQIMRFGRDGIRRVATRLVDHLPVAHVPLYRGMLLDPEEPFTADPDLMFLSWS